MTLVSDRVAALVDEPGLAPTSRLDVALDRVGLWPALSQAAEDAGVPADQLHIVILPEFSGFSPDAPTFTDPALVEHLIDRLHDAGYPRALVAGSADSSALWAGNRDVLALADLLGYSFATPGGREYDVVDLSEDLVEGGFEPGEVLAGSWLSRPWLEAHFRIVFTKNRSDEADGYALCLDTLLGALPLVDEDYHYRLARDPGDVVAELSQRTPVHLALVDAVVSCHGSGGTRAPEPIVTDCLVSATDAWVADHVGALAMGLDPATSRLARRSPLTASGTLHDVTLHGELTVYEGWRPPHPLLRDATRRRDATPGWPRLVRPWLQVLDHELFPLAEPLDARLNATLAPLFADVDNDATTFALLVFASHALANLQQALDAYRTMYAKDDVRRVQVPLGLDLDRFATSDYDAVVTELAAVERLVAGAPERTEGLRWREVDGATLFQYTRLVPVDFDTFVSAVDVARTIQYMNDYLGGVIVPVVGDERSGVRHQAERNLYLPQPNYLALAQGKPIDVAKLEVVTRDDASQRMYWKTVESPNGSAVHDDGVVTFARVPDGTRVTIVGRQHFVLPPVWQALDRALPPEIKTHLVTDAYRTFFDRTMANLEALVEGRDIRIGKPWVEAASPSDTAPLPSSAVQEAVEAGLNWLGRWRGALSPAPGTDSGRPPGSDHAQVGVDEDGFVHFEASTAAPDRDAPRPDDAADSPVAGLTEFWTGLLRAAVEDGRHAWKQPSS